MTDVGLDTFFLLPAPLPSNTTVHVSIYPYSQYFGEAGCSDAFSFTTVACPASTIIKAGICKNDSLLFADSLILAAGLYEWNYALPSGCDSLVQLSVSLFPDEATETDTLLVVGQPYNGIVYERDTTLEFVLQTINGCDSLVRVHLQLVTSIGNPFRRPMARKVFPNPASGEVTLQFGQAPPTAMRVWLFNELGQTVLARKLLAHRQDHRIGIDRLPPGTYRVVAMAEGEVVVIGKLVVL
ncbi:MAG: T9SS type A sorting domain-containing protein [Saprospiraceae bacterium]|nr:T9SS type A sorting domain-containing protein [Saprospiraceae bacterium]MDZ4706269.1 T9SS type A sorting domain-containing protein [Saprospiraceae bacterium]